MLVVVLGTADIFMIRDGREQLLLVLLFQIEVDHVPDNLQRAGVELVGPFAYSVQSFISVFLREAQDSHARLVGLLGVFSAR